MSRETCATLATRCNCTNQHTVANVKSGYTCAQLFNHSDWFMSDYETRLYWILTAQNMKVRAANRSQGNANDRVAGGCMRAFDFFHTNVILSVKDIRFHFFHLNSCLVESDFPVHCRQ